MNFLIRWSWLLVLGVIAAGIPAAILAKNSDPVYKSTATLLIVVDPEASERLTNTYAELVKTRPVLDVVRQRVPTNESYDDFARRIDVESDFNSQLVRITAEDPNAMTAAQIANATVDASLANLDVLFSRPGTVRLAESAQPPLKPAERPAALQAALAAGLGLLVALSIAIGVESLQSNRQAAAAGSRDVSPRPTG